ncbi:MAG: hypothetical protein ACE5HH_01710, partial [Candidatus Hydrothermarchaeales archaeon]
MEDETWELPPAEHPIGVYLGLILSSFILGVGSIVLFISIYALFKAEGFHLTSNFIGRILLFFGSAYGTVASLTALYNMVRFQRLHVKKVEKEFKDFTVYARPLVEEVIRQRLVSQNIAQQLEQMKKAEVFKGRAEKVTARWNETLILVAIMGNVTVGLYLYLDRYPWNMVPYSLIFLAVAWWAVIARHFDFINDSRSYYIPAIYVLIIPSLSIILRAYLELHQVLFLVFFSLVPYILGMYIYYSHVVLGQLPSFIPGRFRGPEQPEELEGESKEDETAEHKTPRKLQEFMPPKN